MEPFKFAGASITGGVAREMATRLRSVEESLSSVFTKGSDEVTSVATYFAWVGLTEAIGGYREGAGRHGRGVAIDVEYSSNPYIATRTNAEYGGEKAAMKLGPDVRVRAVEVYNRAMAWAEKGPADIAARRQNESTEVVWTRFKAVSDALAAYLGLAFKTQDKWIRRRPKLQNRFEDIPEAERLPTDLAIANVRGGGLGATEAEKLLEQLTYDYEAVRIPMVVGAPEASPAITRNPARGFMTLRKELVCALTDVGKLRWGACDFGPNESGDIMHFDVP